MCDTMVALGAATRDGAVIFAKNSDRQPNEPHLMIRIPRRKHLEPYLRATYIQIPQVPETYEVLLLKPSWIWGCEMGCNEFGLNIGNEAVFTREKYGAPGLTGMDMARIALERCQTSEEALEMLVKLLAEFGQGGNCGYEKPFTYHNSFLIADQQSAWVLETAGPYWAAQKVKDIYCISNGLTIGTDFDKYHPQLIRHAVAKGWCRNESGFNFRQCYSDPLFTYFSGAQTRVNASRAMLAAEKGAITVATMKRILRSHVPGMDGKQLNRNSVRSICMHGGGLIGDHTTGSYVAHLRTDACTYWVTGASTPCLSVYKPVWLDEDAPLFSEAEPAKAVEYWKLRERFHRMAMAGLIDCPPYLEARDRLEENFDRLCREAVPAGADRRVRAEISREAFAGEAGLLGRTMAAALKKPDWKGNWYFKHYWRMQNRKLGVNDSWA
jgi:secernin